MKKLLMTAAACVLLTTAAHAAKSNSTILKTKGNWTAYRVISDKGNPMCGMMTYWLSNGNVTAGTHIKYRPGMGLVVQFYKMGWRVPEGTEINTTVQFDDGEVFPGVATTEITKDGSVMLSAEVAEGKYLDFIGSVGEARELKISFPDGNEPTWKWKMDGSRDVAIAFVQCAAALDNNKPTQPTGKPAPTQPTGKATQPTKPMPPVQPTDDRKRVKKDDGSV